jgi:hypothetical protein
MNTQIKCFNIECDGGRESLRYVQTTQEYFFIDSMPEKIGNHDLLLMGDLEESVPQGKGKICCNNCGKEFDLTGKEIKD